MKIIQKMKAIKFALKTVITTGLLSASFSIQAPPQISQYATPELINIAKQLNYRNLESGLHQIDIPCSDRISAVKINKKFSGVMEWFVVWIENDTDHTSAYVYDHYSAKDKSFFIGQPKDGKSELDSDYALVFSTEYNNTQPLYATEDAAVNQNQDISDDDNQTEAGEYQEVAQTDDISQKFDMCDNKPESTDNNSDYDDCKSARSDNNTTNEQSADTDTKDKQV